MPVRRCEPRRSTAMTAALASARADASRTVRPTSGEPPVTITSASVTSRLRTPFPPSSGRSSAPEPVPRPATASAFPLASSRSPSRRRRPSVRGQRISCPRTISITCSSGCGPSTASSSDFPMSGEPASTLTSVTYSVVARSPGDAAVTVRRIGRARGPKITM